MHIGLDSSAEDDTKLAVGQMRPGSSTANLWRHLDRFTRNESTRFTQTNARIAQGATVDRKSDIFDRIGRRRFATQSDLSDRP